MTSTRASTNEDGRSRSAARIRPEWGLNARSPSIKGSVAYMVCRIIKAPGGINYNLFATGRRGPAVCVT